MSLAKHVEKMDKDTLDQLRSHVKTLDRQVFDLSSLIKAGRAMSNILSPDHLYSVFVGIVREKLHSNSLALFIYHNETESFELVKTSGIEEKEFSFKSEEGLLWQTILQNEPFTVVDISGGPLYDDFFEKNDLHWLKSQIWVPLIMLDNVIGIITIGHKENIAHLNNLDLNFLKQIASQASVSINTCCVYDQRSKEKEELDKTVRTLSLLHDVGRAMNYIQDFKNLLRYILKQAIDITKAEKGSIMLYDAETGRLHIRIMEGLADEKVLEQINNAEIETRSFKPGEGVAGKVFETGEPIFLSNLEKDDRFVHAGKSFARSIACVPMVVFSDVIGVINVTNKKDEDSFTEEDAELLKAIADQAAITVNKAQLWEMAVTDSLTGLYIRRFFLAKVNEEMRRSERYKRPFAIIMTDIDHFKNVNDSYGHPEGDVVLKAVSKLIKDTIREVDIVARFGGEEFVILLPETDKENAVILSERLREKISELTFEQVPGVTVSLGISGYPNDGTDIDKLIKKADAALYKAKQTGRNKSVIFSEDIPLIPEKNGEP